MIKLDGFGKACPMPLVMMKEQVDAGETEISIRVDNETAVKNVTRMLDQKGVVHTVAAIEGGWLISTTGGATEEPAATAAPVPGATCIPTGCGYAVFIGKDHVGEGDPQLGYNLMKMALYTLNQAEQAPASLLFMNSGVKLVCGNEEQIIDSVNAMIEKGTEVLVCGTCLNFYGIANQLKVGTVSNMYDILERMHEAAKVITL